MLHTCPPLLAGECECRSSRSRALRNHTLLLTLENRALLLLRLARHARSRPVRWREDGADRLVKDILKPLLRLRARLDVAHRAHLLGHLHALVVRDGREAPLTQPLDRCRVVAQVELGSDENDRHARGVVPDLWDPFLAVSAASDRDLVSSGGGAGGAGSVLVPCRTGAPLSTAATATAEAHADPRFRSVRSDGRGTAKQSVRLTVLMFSNDGGEITEKHTRKTSVCGYDRGRKRLYVSWACFSGQNPCDPFCMPVGVGCYREPTSKKAQRALRVGGGGVERTVLARQLDSLIVLLASRVPQPERDRSPVDEY